MPRLTVEAPAKLNLTLDVLGRRSDGYHELRMVMQSVALADRITLETGTGGGVRVRTNLSFLPTNEKNLAAAAALQFLEDCGLDCGGLSISVEKHIPVCAGTGGEALARLGERVGSDVPYCVLGGTALAEGRGEVLTPLPALPRCHAVLCKPAFSISTPELFARVDGVKLRHRPDTEGMVVALEGGDLGGAARRMYNIFEDVLPPRQAEEISGIKNVLVQHGALGANMSGTGPTVFGLFERAEDAAQAWEELRGTYRDTFLTETL